MTGIRYDVAVVGLGPVGSVAALLLAEKGLSVLAVDEATGPYDKPRAIGLDQEALRILQETGVADDLAPSLGAYRPSEYRSASGELLRRIIPAPQPYPLAWPPYSTFVQPELERLLRTRLAERPELRIELGTRFCGLLQDDRKVTLSFAQRDRSFEESARFVVGCDGAWSPVREAVNLKLEDLNFDEPWLVVDVLVNDSAQLPESIIQYCDPARPCTFVPGPANLRRWEIMLLPGEDPGQMAEEQMVWNLLGKWLTPDQGQIWRKATYRFHALVARQWRCGRVFIAGDAAHQTPPFMAQGLNQGLRDAGNLAWKIAEVLRGNADAQLLETYDQERRPNSKTVITLTKELGRVICERDPDAAAVRDARMIEEVRTGRGEIVRQSLLPPLTEGLLLREQSGNLAPGAGTVFPQPWIDANGHSRRMDDVLGSEFLMVLPSGMKVSERLRSEAGALNVRLAVVDAKEDLDGVLALREQDAVLSSWMHQHGARIALVRPDHVAFGTGKFEEDASRLLNALRRQLRGQSPSDFESSRASVE